MPKIKLTGKGYDKMTGLFGNIEFVDGVSVEEVSRRDAERLGSLTSVIDVDTKEEMNAAKGVEVRLRSGEKTRNVESAESESGSETDSEVAETENSENSTEGNVEASDKLYTEAELGNIADEEGIAGLRTIAESLNVSDKSVRGLITKILKAQA